MPSAVLDSHEDARQAEFDEAAEEFMRGLPALDNDNSLNHDAPARDIDEEVKVTRKRKQVQKLDDALLLSERGIPRLRKISKDRIRFKGKGHEFSDISRLLNTYQLWLDDLYPKAKFKDALVMVEKLGHSRRMQVTRRAWIDSSKPNRAQEDEERIGDAEMSGAIDQHAEGSTPEDRGEAGGEEQNSDMQQRSFEAQAPEADELDALLNEHEHSSWQLQTRPRTQIRRGPFEDEEDADEPDEDELDALLAEERTEQRVEVASGRRPLHMGGEPDEDDLDALLAAETATSTRPRDVQQERASGNGFARREPVDHDEEEELAASMGW